MQKCIYSYISNNQTKKKSCISDIRSYKGSSLNWNIMTLKKFHNLPLDVPHGQLISSKAERSFTTSETKDTNMQDLPQFVYVKPE